MTYPLPAWQDSPSVATPLDSANLLMYNDAINGLTSSIATLSTLASTLTQATARSIALTMALGTFGVSA